MQTYIRTMQVFFLISMYNERSQSHTNVLNVCIGESTLRQQWSNWVIAHIIAHEYHYVFVCVCVCLWIADACIFYQETRWHFAELNGGSWADSYHSRRQSDRHYHRHCPSVLLAATSTLSFRGISFVLEYNLLRNLISNTIQSTFPMRQVKISWAQVMHLFAKEK